MRSCICQSSANLLEERAVAGQRAVQGRRKELMRDLELLESSAEPSCSNQHSFKDYILTKILAGSALQQQQHPGFKKTHCHRHLQYIHI